MITNKPEKGQILIFESELKQRAIRPEDLPIKKEKLGDKLARLEESNKELEKRVLKLQKNNKVIFDILLMLIQQANINLTQQQLLLLKNKEEK